MADPNGPTTYVDVDNVRDNSEIHNIYNNEAINQKIDTLLEEHESPPIKKSFSPADVHEGVCSSISTVLSTLILLGGCLIIVGIPPLYLHERKTQLIYVAILIPALTILGTIIQFYSLEVPMRRFNRFLLQSARELDKHREYMQKAAEVNRAAKRSFAIKLPREVSDGSSKENERSVFADFNKEKHMPFVYSMSPAARGEDHFDVEREMKWVDGQLHRFVEANEVSLQPLMRQQQRILKVFLLAFIELQKMLLSFIIKEVHHSETASRVNADSMISRTPVDLLDSRRLALAPLATPKPAGDKLQTSIHLPNFTPLVKSAVPSVHRDGVSTLVASPDARPPFAEDAATEELGHVSLVSSNGEDVAVDVPTEDGTGRAAQAAAEQPNVAADNGNAAAQPAEEDEAAFPQNNEEAANELQDAPPHVAAAAAALNAGAPVILPTDDAAEQAYDHEGTAPSGSVPAPQFDSVDEMQVMSGSKRFEQSGTAAPRRSTITLVRGNRFYTDSPNVFFYVVVVQLDAQGNNSKKPNCQPKVFGFEANMAHSKNDVPRGAETITPLFKPGKDNRPYVTFWSKDHARQTLTIMERRTADFVYCHVEEQHQDPFSDLSSLAVKVGEDGQPMAQRANSLGGADRTSGNGVHSPLRESSFPEPFKAADSFVVAWAPLPDRPMRLTFLWVNLQWRNVSVLSPLPAMPLDEAVMHQNLNGVSTNNNTAATNGSAAQDTATAPTDLFQRFMPRTESAYTLLPPPSPDHKNSKNRNKGNNSFVRQSGEGPPQWMCVPVMECVINGVFCVLTSATIYVNEKDSEKALFAELRGISIEDLSGSSRGTSLDEGVPSPHQPAGTVVREAIKL